MRTEAGPTGTRKGSTTTRKALARLDELLKTIARTAEKADWLTKIPR